MNNQLRHNSSYKKYSETGKTSEIRKVWQPWSINIVCKQWHEQQGKLWSEAKFLNYKGKRLTSAIHTLVLSAITMRSEIIANDERRKSKIQSWEKITTAHIDSIEGQREKKRMGYNGKSSLSDQRKLKSEKFDYLNE